jgi:hypothetical protein
MEVREAVAAAKTYLAQVFDGEEIEDLRLEEVEYDDSRGRWLVTLGFLRSVPSAGRAGPLSRNMQKLLANKSREYKVVTVDDERGAVSIKNREGLPVS